MSLLNSKLASTRRKHVSFRMGAGLAAAVAIFIAAIGAIMLLDYWLELPRVVRAALLGLTLLRLAYVLVREVLVALIWAPDDDEVALWIEKKLPALRSRLISSVQLTRRGAISDHEARSLVRELLHQTETATAPFDFSAVVSAKRITRLTMIAILVVVIAAAGMVRAGNDGVDLVKRAFLVPGVDVPRRTRVIIDQPRQLIARGDVATIRARAEGVIPNEGAVEVRSAGQRVQKYRLPKEEGRPDEFVLNIQNVQAAFEYTIYLNDGRSVDCRIDVAERPAAVAVRVRQVFPKYTGLGEVDRATGDLQILAGSKLAIDVTANKDVVSGRAHLHGAEKDQPLRIDPADAKHLGPSDVTPPVGTTGLSIHLTDSQGLSTKDPAVYRIELVPDRPPSLRMTSPDRREDLVTRRAQIVIALDAADDFGIAKVGLLYKLQGTNAQPKRIELNVPPNARTFRGYYPLKIDSLSPIVSEGQTIEWWIEVQDANDQTGPGVTSSEHYAARIVSDEEKRADLMNRLGNYLGQINEVSDNQRDLSTKLGQLITEKKE